MKRRNFLALAAFTLPARSWAAKGVKLDLAAEKARVARAAERYLDEKPVTITASRNPRSAGGVHDFSSEGDYWWPDPKNPNGPYIQRDGMSNPENFVEHRKAMMRLSVQMPALAAAWVLTGDKKYAQHAGEHLRAWFIEPKTLMNPHLLYSQAIHNLNTGRSIGVIDTVHLVEVARAAAVLERSPALPAKEQAAVKKWFADYLTWITTHEYGTKERDAKNNHGTCWVMQAAEFARFTGNTTVTDYCRDRFKTVLVPNQIAPDGSFPEELRRTKPYGYCLFQLDIISTVAQILSRPKDDLWRFQTKDGRSLERALAWMFPFIEDKKRWKQKPDVMYFDQWPIAHPALVFGGLALERPEYLAVWQRLEKEPKVDEVVRNYPIRQPVLWGERAGARRA
jgi:hypothetical protein